MMNLASKKCVPCEGGTLPLEQEKIEEYLREVEGWELKESSPSTPFQINKTFKFKTFRESIGFVDQVANLAEQEKHHPDIFIRYRKVTSEAIKNHITLLRESENVSFFIFYNIMVSSNLRLPFISHIMFASYSLILLYINFFY